MKYFEGFFISARLTGLGRFSRSRQILWSLSKNVHVFTWAGGLPWFPRPWFFQPGSQELDKNFSHTNSSARLPRTKTKNSFSWQKVLTSSFFCDRENYEARTGANIHLIQYNPGNCQSGSCEEALRTAPVLVQLMRLWTNQKCCRYLPGA